MGLHDENPDEWWQIAGELTAEVCEHVERRCAAYGTRLQPADAIAFLMVALGRFAGRYGGRAGTTEPAAWAALLNCKEMFLAGYRTDSTAKVVTLLAGRSTVKQRK